jgi:preprotein translocase subunit SecD
VRRAVALALLVVACAKPEGGVKLVYGGGAPAQSVVVKRLKSLAVRGATAEIEGVDLAVYVPGGRRLDEVKKALALAGKLELSYVVEGEAADESATGEWVEVPIGAEPVHERTTRMFAGERAAIEAALPTLKLPKGRVLISPEEAGFRLWVLDEKPELTGEHVAQAEASVEKMPGGPVVMLTFDEAGKRELDQATARGIQRRLAIILDGRVLSAPVVQERISGGSAQITLGAKGTLDEAKAMAAALGSGGLSEPLRLAKEEVFAPREPR